ncbi:Glyoxylase, beta-lactamase superfamily II [Austwickia chelonae]|uniref:Metallo-beta-lactamase domain-containing protein n=1 Tax=Austwickia chelonae NBRC 105200 TaxID=1184607 RepID=K6V5M2_9MICO|nr:MBL fold metallo-hydrolase [Austwickia chelonae]GAB77493.1 hypothetical protein AUCHE_05_04050 [Austwickia chelonae NBRC 105200]SEW11485.1 Glyoxylase, beta-lactamase superfamily II [Austwickia chelonae]
MLVIGFPAAAFGTNCFVVAQAAREECLVIDPGIGVVDRLEAVLSEHSLKPAAVLLTHGHIDHIYSVPPVCDAHAVAAHVHAADRYRLKDALSQLDPQLTAMLGPQFSSVATWHDPDELVEFVDGAELSLAGLTVRVVHAPGHTEGSVLFGIDGVPEGVGEDSGLSRTLFSGDVLFAGSVGRTDLPGGSDEVMRRTLREVVLAQPDDTLVLPGHGPATTIGHERSGNPFLQSL